VRLFATFLVGLTLAGSGRVTQGVRLAKHVPLTHQPQHPAPEGRSPLEIVRSYEQDLVV
jgi:hypothetical protein